MALLFRDAARGGCRLPYQQLFSKCGWSAGEPLHSFDPSLAAKRDAVLAHSERQLSLCGSSAVHFNRRTPCRVLDSLSHTWMDSRGRVDPGEWQTSPGLDCGGNFCERTPPPEEW